MMALAYALLASNLGNPVIRLNHAYLSLCLFSFFVQYLLFIQLLIIDDIALAGFPGITSIGDVFCLNLRSVQGWECWTFFVFLGTFGRALL